MLVRPVVHDGPSVRVPRSSLTVVIPVKNDAECLARCLTALARQTVLAQEIIVIDNGSDDCYAALARSFGVRVIAELAPGITAASATGYGHAGDVIIGRLDADCIPADDWIERIHESFERSAEVSAITGGTHFIDGPRFARGIAT